MLTDFKNKNQKLTIDSLRDKEPVEKEHEEKSKATPGQTANDTDGR